MDRTIPERPSNYYEFLGVSSHAQKRIIAAAYHEIIARLNENIFCEATIPRGEIYEAVDAAWQTLGERRSRTQYDCALADGTAATVSYKLQREIVAILFDQRIKKGTSTTKSIAGEGQPPSFQRAEAVRRTPRRDRAPARHSSMGGGVRPSPPPMSQETKTSWLTGLAAAFFGYFVSAIGALFALLLVLAAFALLVDLPKEKRALALRALIFAAIFLVSATIHGLTDHPTARCGDGTYSYSAHHSGTCSWHQGVVVWDPQATPWWERLNLNRNGINDQ